MKIWLTADNHFEHFALCNYNGRPGDFTQRIFRNLAALPYDDVLINLGDVCMGPDAAVHAKYVWPIPCKTKILIRGNHDHKSDHWYMEHGWSFVCEEMTVKVMGKRVLLSHEPKLDKGEFDLNVHGHFHSSNFRLHDFENAAILTPKHHLFAVEYTNYMPVPLETFVKQCLEKE